MVEVTVLIRGSYDLDPNETQAAQVEFDPESLEFEMLQRLGYQGVAQLLHAYMRCNGYTMPNRDNGEYVCGVYLFDQPLGEPDVDKWVARDRDRVNDNIKNLNL